MAGAGKRSSTVPVGLRLQIENLEAGTYQLQVTVFDDAGRRTTRTASMEID